MLTIEEVKKLATLSRMNLSPNELETIRKDLSSILGYVDEIKNVVNL